MAFSPPVVGCLVKKGLQRRGGGGSRAPRDLPLATPLDYTYDDDDDYGLIIIIMVSSIIMIIIWAPFTWLLMEFTIFRFMASEFQNTCIQILSIW